MQPSQQHSSDRSAFWTLLWLAAGSSPRMAASGLWNLLRGRKVRGLNLLNVAAAESPSYYNAWVASSETKAKVAHLADLPSLPLPPIVCLIIGDSDTDRDRAERSRASIRTALGDAVTIACTVQNVPDCQFLDSTNLKDLIEKLSEQFDPREAPWLLPIAAGDEIAPDLGVPLGPAIRQAAERDLIFWDEDRLGPHGREAPWIKPDWDDVLFSSRDGLLSASLIAARPFLAFLRGVEPIPLDRLSTAKALMRCARRADISPLHLPLILTHRSAAESAPYSPSNGPVAPTSWPDVSIIIPTRDQAALLRDCIAGLELLRYGGPVEIILIDNGTSDPEAFDLIADIERDGKVKVLRRPGPFNFAALNNEAVRLASGRFVCLINNDVQATDGAWLGELVQQAMRDDSGAIGAMLLYPDGTVQHAGVAIGIGGAAGHVQKGARLDDALFESWFKATRTVSAVTGACLLVEKAKYESVGGMDETSFPVAFNDVDLCLKLQAAGWRNIYVANATLIHHESKSRGLDSAAVNSARFKGELEALQGRWGTKGFRDPYFSPLFSRSTERCTLNF